MSSKIKDQFLDRLVKSLLSDVKFYNTKLYPKKPISVDEIINQIKNQTND